MHAYHGTTKSRLKTILFDGFSPNSYFSPDYLFALSVAKQQSKNRHSNPIVIEVELDRKTRYWPLPSYVSGYTSRVIGNPKTEILSINEYDLAGNPIGKIDFD